ncbi:MAG: hypothetical protein KGH64_02140 [Candidatus Micrarchaeota archaeon]|nr:hypothetical protein [Candidatus Micrarchaeota archaeon]MDE1834117.1 hypothetical protein [Candidatus Micrarchaeota archaeon]MDE1859032.1 hypothetical protein [Candidatus Micrarchaeota archaeon]
MNRTTGKNAIEFPNSAIHITSQPVNCSDAENLLRSQGKRLAFVQEALMDSELVGSLALSLDILVARTPAPGSNGIYLIDRVGNSLSLAPRTNTIGKHTRSRDYLRVIIRQASDTKRPLILTKFPDIYMLTDSIGVPAARAAVKELTESEIKSAPKQGVIPLLRPL